MIASERPLRANGDLAKGIPIVLAERQQACFAKRKLWNSPKQGTMLWTRATGLLSHLSVKRRGSNGSCLRTFSSVAEHWVGLI